MTSHCANPACAIPLRYLREGRLFQFEVKLANSDPKTRTALARKLPGATFHYWLCGKCSSTLTLVFDTLKGVVVKPRPAA